MRISRSMIVGFGVAAGIAVVAVALWHFADQEVEIALRPEDTTVVAEGRDIYQQQCASCHGVNLEGQKNWRQRLPSGLLPAPPHDDTGHTWHHSDAVLFELTKLGPAAIAGRAYESAMPAYTEVLSDGQIIAVLSYIKSRWPESLQRRHDGLNRPVR